MGIRRKGTASKRLRIRRPGMGLKETPPPFWLRVVMTGNSEEKLGLAVLVVLPNRKSAIRNVVVMKIILKLDLAKLLD